MDPTTDTAFWTIITTQELERHGPPPDYGDVGLYVTLTLALVLFVFWLRAFLRG